MMPTKQLNSNVVTSIADDDLVTIPSPQGGLQNITFANLMKAIRDKFSNPNLAKGTSSVLKEIDTYVSNLSRPLNPGETVTVSFDIDWDGDTRPYMEVYLAVTEGGSIADRNMISASDIVKGKNTRSLTLSKAATKFCVYHRAADVIRLGSVKVETGTTATNWSPAPEDYDSWGGGNWLLRNQLQFNQEGRCA